MTERSATLIDNIITNDSCNIISGAILSDVSDHLPIYCICENDIKTSRRTTLCEKRVIDDANICNFLRSLESTIFSLDQHDGNESYNNFIESFLDVYNLNFPQKKKFAR